MPGGESRFKWWAFGKKQVPRTRRTHALVAMQPSVPSGHPVHGGSRLHTPAGEATCRAAPDPTVLSPQEEARLVDPERGRDGVPLGLGHDSLILLSLKQRPAAGSHLYRGLESMTHTLLKYVWRLNNHISENRELREEMPIVLNKTASCALVRLHGSVSTVRVCPSGPPASSPHGRPLSSRACCVWS